MKKLLTSVLAAFVLSSTSVSASAQETKSDKKVKLEIGIGLNFSGPQMQMADLMKKYGYGMTKNGWIIRGIQFGGNIKYPIYSNVGFNTYISLSYLIAPRSQVGIRLSRSTFGETSGYSGTKGFLGLSFKNTSIIPVYTFQPNKVFEIQVGPALMINSVKNTTSGTSVSENKTINTIGLFTGLNLIVWNRKVTYGKINANYLLAPNSKIGPYNTYGSDGNLHQFPESTINFSYLNLGFSIGFNL